MLPSDGTLRITVSWLTGLDGFSVLSPSYLISHRERMFTFRCRCTSRYHTFICTLLLLFIQFIALYASAHISSAFIPFIAVSILLLYTYIIFLCSSFSSGAPSRRNYMYNHSVVCGIATYLQINNTWRQHLKSCIYLLCWLCCSEALWHKHVAFYWQDV